MDETDIAARLHRHLAAEAVHEAAAAASAYAEDGYYENCALGLRFEGRAAVEWQYAVSFETVREMTVTYLFEHIEGDTALQCGRIRLCAPPRRWCKRPRT